MLSLDNEPLDGCGLTAFCLLAVAAGVFVSAWEKKKKSNILSMNPLK